MSIITQIVSMMFVGMIMPLIFKYIVVKNKTKIYETFVNSCALA